MSDLALIIGSRIQTERKKLGMTQKELACRLSIVTKQVWSYEKGHLLPPISKIIELSTIFGCSVSYLLGEQESKRLSIEDKCIIDSTGLSMSSLNSIRRLTGAQNTYYKTQRTPIPSSNTNTDKDTSNLDTKSIRALFAGQRSGNESISDYFRSLISSDYDNNIEEDIRLVPEQMLSQLTGEYTGYLPYMHFSQKEILNLLISSEYFIKLIQQLQNLKEYSGEYLQLIESIETTHNDHSVLDEINHEIKIKELEIKATKFTANEIYTHLVDDIIPNAFRIDNDEDFKF